MKVSFRTRVLFLVAVAFGLLLALGVHAMTRPDPFRFSWRLEDEREPAQEASHGDDASSSRSSATSDAPPRFSPQSYSNNQFYGGGDEDVDGVPVTETGSPTPTVDVASDSSSASVVGDDGASGQGGGASVTVPGTEAPTPNPDFMVGLSSSSNTGPALFVTPSRTVDPGRPWVYGQGRGYAMLYALQPEARVVTEANISALLASRVREPYVGILIDGTFGRDFEYLRDIIYRLNSDGRKLHLALYLSNGATQRQWRSTPIEAPFVKVDPYVFRRQIRRDAQVQAQYRALAADARVLFQYNLQVNPEAINYAVLMLEDNLDSESFRSMLNIAMSELEGSAIIVRNPCVGCNVDGTTNETFGNLLEEHGVGRLIALKPAEGFTLDGSGFLYPGEVGNGDVKYDELLSSMGSAYRLNLSYFGLWRENWQGVVEGQPNPHPSKRSYVASTVDQMEYEVRALREGLPVEESP